MVFQVLDFGIQGFRRAAVSAACVLLAACGGGGGAGTGATAGSATGVLTDAEVQGVRYVTSSGVTGTTDAQGRYSYNPGDTVTFSIGAVTLGQVPASGVVTPIQLAGGSSTKMSNLLVLLQSLDADGNPGNGLTIPAAAASALTSIDLGAPLSGAAMSAITTAMQAGGVQGTVKTAGDAQAHFLTQAPKLMASNIWVATQPDGKPETVLYFRDDGSYLIGNFAQAGNGGSPGFETGRISPNVVDANGFALNSTVVTDANGEWGLSHPQSSERFAPDGDRITVTDSLETVTRSAMENAAGGLVGAWRIATTSSRSPAGDGLFLFFNNGYFAMVDAVGESQYPDVTVPCSTGGVELGKYTYNTSTKVVTPSAPELNTNNCVGFFESTLGVNSTVHSIIISADGATAVWQGQDAEGTWTVNLVRVSK